MPERCKSRFPPPPAPVQPPPFSYMPQLKKSRNPTNPTNNTPANAILSRSTGTKWLTTRSSRKKYPTAMQPECATRASRNKWTAPNPSNANLETRTKSRKSNRPPRRSNPGRIRTTRRKSNQSTAMRGLGEIRRRLRWKAV
jgi:hypothetical protein